MKRRCRITPRAHRDLVDIARYTMRTWGRAQRNAYLRDLDARFGWLADNPWLGRAREDIGPGYFSYPQGAHVIFYLIGDASIDVIGVPHRSMDLAGFFDAE